MQNTLIDNSANSLTMTSILRRCISSTGLKEIKIATGYWDIPGISLVVSELRAFLEQDDAKLKLVIGRKMLYYSILHKAVNSIHAFFILYPIDT